MARKSEIKERSPKGVENSLISMAMKLAEEKLRDGTASSQLICHFLKLATEREKLENEKLKSYLKVSEAKIKRLESMTSSSELYEEAIKAFRNYSGLRDVDEDV